MQKDHPKQPGDLRVLFWNIRDWSHKTGPRHFNRILATLRREKPDIALFAEIMSPTIKTELARRLPGSVTLFETADKNQRHLLAAFNHAAGINVTVEQRNEFSNDPLTKRTYPLLRLFSREFNLAVLAVHTDSGANPEDLALRQSALAKIIALNNRLMAENTPLLALGDMNSMGNGGTVSPRYEQEIMSKILTRNNMTVLPKNRHATWHGIGPDKIYPDTDLDHAFLSTSATALARPVNTRGHQVRVSGWPDRRYVSQRDHWVKRYSDHAYLVVDIKPTIS